METTKCDKCDGEGVRWVDGSEGGCNWCSGTGVAGTPFIRSIEACENFIDVEATLRATVARLDGFLIEAHDRLAVMTGDVETLRAKLAESEERLREVTAQRDAVNQLLSDHGCDCDCQCDGDGHVCDGPVCFPCQVEAAMKGATR